MPVRKPAASTRATMAHDGTSGLTVPRQGNYGAGLWALFPHLFDKPDPRTGSQPVEPGVQYAVAMKVDLPAIDGLQEAVILEGGCCAGRVFTEDSWNRHAERQILAQGIQNGS